MYIVYISEIGGLRSEPPGVRGVDGATPAHSNQYSTRTYDKHNCATAIVVRSISVAFCCNVLNIITMQTKVKSVQRLHDVESGEVLNKFVVYTTNAFNTIKSRKNGFIDVESNSISLFDSYVYSVVFDAINGLKEGRIYSDLLNNSIDTDRVVELLLSNSIIDVEVSKEDSENPDNSLGYYYKYNIKNVVLSIDEFTNVTLFELYKATFADKSKAYLSFVAKMLQVFDIFKSELV